MTVRTSLHPLAVRSAALALGVALLVAGACTQGAGGTFDPLGPCTSDGQEPGAYPQLEAHIPSRFEGAAPARLDSGRNCSDANLGTLTEHGIDELRFAGGLWETGERSGVSMAVFSAPGLTVDRLARFYEAGARTARKTEAIETSDFEVDGVRGWRLDTLNDDSFQTIVVLDSGQPDLVRAVLVASDIREVGTRRAHDEMVELAAGTAVANP